jgi:2-C-methyl-D-erythritol 2,4-cyclodiphosphate synthase
MPTKRPSRSRVKARTTPPATGQRAARRGGAGPGSPPGAGARAASPRSRGTAVADLRIGHGWDLHRLEPLMAMGGAGQGRPLMVGGVLLATAAEFDRGPAARSDGDVLLHAVTDALLGALALPDIGQLFPDTDEANEGRDSRDFLLAAMAKVRALGYRVVNLDATVILQRPKLSPHKSEIIDGLAELLGVDRGQVNIKGKTHERVDAVGESRAIEAHAVVLLSGR